MKWKWFCRICKRGGLSEFELDLKASTALHSNAISEDLLRNPIGREDIGRNNPGYELFGATKCKGDLRFGLATANARRPKAEPLPMLPDAGEPITLR